MHLLVVHPMQGSLPPGTTELLASIGWQITPAFTLNEAAAAARRGSIDAAILTELNGESANHSATSEFHALLRVMENQRIATLVLSDDPKPEPAHSMIESIPRNIPLPELRGRLAMIERYHGHFKLMDRELSDMQRLGQRLKRHFRELDHELRLAGRLQRDFLPNLAKPIGGIRFAAIFRPASWVSGDLFDVFEIDENVVGFYVIDAVGHGMSAGLLTMFIKRALQDRRSEAEDASDMTPSRTLRALNNTLVNQKLPNCQFVTACYGLFNRRTRVLEHARAGNPYPHLLSRRGKLRTLQSSGGLLGIIPGESFPTRRTQLQPGDRVFFYTDGLELVLEAGESSARPDSAVRSALSQFGLLTLDGMFQALEQELDDRIGSLNPPDDVTVLAFKVPENGGLEDGAAI